MNNLFTISFVLMFATCALNAQHIQNNNSWDRMVTLGLNSDALTGVEVGYMQNPGILAEKDFHIYIRFSFPLLLVVKDKSFDTWEIKVGANSQLFRKGNFGTLVDLQLYLMHHEQILGTFMPVGYNICITPVHYFTKGYLGLQINWNQTITTHISHSQYVKDTFSNLNILNKMLRYNSPQNGWYNDTGSHFGFGIEGGAELGDLFFLYGDFGMLKFSSPYTNMFDAMMMGQVPFYGNLRLTYKL